VRECRGRGGLLEKLRGRDELRWLDLLLRRLRIEAVVRIVRAHAILRLAVIIILALVGGRLILLRSTIWQER